MESGATPSPRYKSYVRVVDRLTSRNTIFHVQFGQLRETFPNIPEILRSCGTPAHLATSYMWLTLTPYNRYSGWARRMPLLNSEATNQFSYWKVGWLAFCMDLLLHILSQIGGPARINMTSQSILVMKVWTESCDWRIRTNHLITKDRVAILHCLAFAENTPDMRKNMLEALQNADITEDTKQALIETLAQAWITKWWTSRGHHWDPM